MKQLNIINSLILWIEENLSRPLSLDLVAQKSGYTKWHLQRMFKEVTGQKVGSYIRGRQLSKSAVALRLTSRSIMDISDQYQFNSQQSFTRAFKQQFGKTPGKYRRAEDWDVRGIQPPIILMDELLPQARFVTLEPFTLWVLTGKYRSTLDSFAESRTMIRERLWQDIIDKNESLPANIYGIHQVFPGSHSHDEQILFYGIGMTNQHIKNTPHHYEIVTIDTGLYVEFTYQGLSADFQNFILKLYNSVLPSMGLTRRKGYDIERYYTDPSRENESLPVNIRCDYLVPVIRHEEQPAEQ